jgi:5-methylcytosine-specific restriction endonuclease McrA
MDSKYCSSACYLSHRWGESHKHPVACKYCGKQIISYEVEINSGRKYCSSGCYNNDTKGQPRESRHRRLTKICEWCGKSFTRPISDFHAKHYFCSIPCAAKWRSEFGLRGEQHHNYINGKGNNYGEHWSAIRNSVLSNAKNNCALCHSNANVDVHHIIPYKFFSDSKSGNKKENLIALCRKCHAKEEWKARGMLPLFYAALKIS